MLLSFFYAAVRRLLQLLVLGRQSETQKDLEIVVLRHKLTVLRRQMKRPVFRASDPAFLTAVSTRPSCLSSTFRAVRTLAVAQRLV